MVSESLLKSQKTINNKVLLGVDHLEETAIPTDNLLSVLKTRMCYFKALETSQGSKRLKSDVLWSFGYAEE